MFCHVLGSVGFEPTTFKFWASQILAHHPPAAHALPILYINFNRIGVRSFILSGAPSLLPVAQNISKKDPRRPQTKSCV